MCRIKTSKVSVGMKTWIQFFNATSFVVAEIIEEGFFSRENAQFLIERPLLLQEALTLGFKAEIPSNDPIIEPISNPISDPQKIRLHGVIMGQLWLALVHVLFEEDMRKLSSFFGQDELRRKMYRSLSHDHVTNLG
jgi:hypothetical protein